MAEEPQNIALELLRHIRASSDRMENDIRDIKFRLAQLEEKAQHHTGRFDRLDDRLLTMEKRLGLVDA